LAAASTVAVGNWEDVGVRVDLYEMPWPGPGRLSTMARPRGGDWLDDEMTAVRSQGVDVLVSLLELVEAAELGLASERRAAEAAGVTFIGLPIPDRSVPSRSEFLALVEKVAELLAAGRHVAVHCRAGIGRSSTVAAGVLLRAGMTPDEVWPAMSKARGLAVPDTAAQKSWVEDVILADGHGHRDPEPEGR
jgi:protein-tyrosine phosphatase